MRVSVSVLALAAACLGSAANVWAADASPKDFPGFAKLARDPSPFFPAEKVAICPAFLLSKDWIIADGYCFIVPLLKRADEKPLTKFGAEFGEQAFKTNVTKPYKYNVGAAVGFETDTWMLDSIRIAKVDPSAPSDATPIKIASNKIKPDDTVTILTYGVYNTPSDPKYPQTLQQVSAKIVAMDKCNTAIPKLNLPKGNSYCIEFKTGFAASSIGGSLVLSSDKSLIGSIVRSSTSGTGDAGVPKDATVYGVVEAYLEAAAWMAQKIGIKQEDLIDPSSPPPPSPAPSPSPPPPPQSSSSAMTTFVPHVTLAAGVAAAIILFV
ncbi:hypothetical protein GQ42DRAFT_161797 [Ramicandelaber brevisporus]|nr:hypothetical protein GQ42DRAFT_161797 [Ramicandelaber brevisporus]